MSDTLIAQILKTAGILPSGISQELMRFITSPSIAFITPE